MITLCLGKHIMYTTVLVGLDGSSGSWHAFAHATAYAKRTGAHVIGMLAESPFWAPPPMGQHAFECMIANMAGAAALRQDIAFEFHVRSDYPAHAILAEARASHCDLIVLGHTSDDAVQRFYAGSISGLVARQAPCAVLVIRDGDVADIEPRIVPVYDPLAHGSPPAALRS
jgi:nucleotide-binding universal stress UspA family protein